MSPGPILKKLDPRVIIHVDLWYRYLERKKCGPKDADLNEKKILPGPVVNPVWRPNREEETLSCSVEMFFQPVNIKNPWYTYRGSLPWASIHYLGTAIRMDITYHYDGSRSASRFFKQNVTFFKMRKEWF
jgi:hypothetical protein